MQYSMKYRNKIAYLPLMAALLVGFYSCGIKQAAKNFDEKAEMKANPEVLEVHGDSVAYQVTLDAPEKSVNKNVTIEIQPVLKYNGTTDNRPTQNIQGTKAKNGQGQVITKDGGKVTWSDKVAYKPEMKSTELIAQTTVKRNGEDEVLNQCIILEDKLLATGIIATSQMAKEDGSDLVQSADPYVASEAGRKITLYYLINSGTFSPTFVVKKGSQMDNKAQIKAMQALVKDSAYVVRNITINSFASPDGELRRNEELSKSRSKSTFTFLKKELKKLGFQEVNDSSFYMSSALNEDWDGLRKAVEISTLKDKDAILALINSKMDNEAKEMRLKSQFPESYNIMRDEILPSLRRSVITFNSSTPLKSNEELKTYASKLDELSALEAIQLAKISTDNAEKRRIYNYLINKYPSDWRAYNNLAIVDLNENKLQDAVKNLTKADELSQNNAIVLNNLAVANRRLKDYKTAEDLFKRALALNDTNVNANAGLANLYLKAGKYDEANNAFSSTKSCDFNYALALILKKDYDGAKKVLDCVPTDKKDANYYYLYSVLGARTNNTELLTSNLTRSIQLDASKKEYAKTDYEFKDFWKKPEFQSAIR